MRTSKFRNCGGGSTRQTGRLGWPKIEIAEVWMGYLFKPTHFHFQRHKMYIYKYERKPTNLPQKEDNFYGKEDQRKET